MLTGSVMWFSEAKGYGFIASPAGDVFVHWKAIAGKGFKTLCAGEEVQYEVEQTPNGLQAVKVIRQRRGAQNGD